MGNIILSSVISI